MTTGLLGIASALGLGSAAGAKALAREVGAPRLRVVALGDAVARALEQAGHEAVRATLENDRIGLDDGAADALCASGLPEIDVAPRLLAECARVVKPGGRVLVATAAGLTRRGPERHVVTAVLLHAGLMDLTQRMSRGVLITAGRVRR
jgi:ubiquinone/menaquinone biosynthesis C-methylase UbiE